MPESAPLFSILLALSAAATWGVGDFAGGMATRKANVYRVVLLAEAAGVVVLLVLGLLNGEGLPPPQALGYGAVAGLFGLAGLLLLFQALAQGQMSIAAPLSALLGALAPVVFGAWFEGFPGWLTLLGFGLALAAVWLISAEAGNGGGQRAQWQQLGLPLLAGLAFGVYFILLNLGGKQAVFGPLIAARLVATGALLGFLLLKRQPLLPEQPGIRLALLNGVCDSTANLLYVLAGRMGRLDITAVLGSLYPAATVMMAWIFLHERLSRPQWLGVALALLAIVLIAV